MLAMTTRGLEDSALNVDSRIIYSSLRSSCCESNEVNGYKGAAGLRKFGQCHHDLTNISILEYIAKHVLEKSRRSL